MLEWSRQSLVNIASVSLSVFLCMLQRCTTLSISSRISHGHDAYWILYISNCPGEVQRHCRHNEIARAGGGFQSSRWDGIFNCFGCFKVLDVIRDVGARGRKVQLPLIKCPCHTFSQNLERFYFQTYKSNSFILKLVRPEGQHRAFWSWSAITNLISYRTIYTQDKVFPKCTYSRCLAPGLDLVWTW